MSRLFFKYLRYTYDLSIDRKLVTCLLFLILLSNSIIAQQDSLTLFESLYGKEIPHIHIKTKLKQIIKKKAKKENHVGTLTYQNKDGISQEYTIKLKARGNMRNKVCFLPPLKIDFKKSDLASAGIRRDFDDLKLVVKCKSSDNYEDLLLKEYLTYKLYNNLTEVSFRVQLIKLTLEDVDGKQKNIEAYAFLIESLEELVERVNGQIRGTLSFQDKYLDPSSYDRMCLFEFMIGNADWHIFKQHNTKIIALNEQKIAVSIPYDFDFSGIVETPYATPHTQLPINHIKQRYYLGPCRDPDTLKPTFELFREKKSDLLATIENFEELNIKSRKSMLKYLNGFFEILDSPKACNNQIIKHCDKHIKVN